MNPGLRPGRGAAFGPDFGVDEVLRVLYAEAAAAGRPALFAPGHDGQARPRGHMLKEFKEFAVRGNVIDMAVGVIIGGAFGKIVSSMVSDLLMPPIGLLLGKVNFASLFVSLNGEEYASLEVAKTAGAPTLNYGVFLQHSFDFIILAFVIFLMVQQINRLKPKAPEEAPKTRDCPLCFSSIPKQATRCAHCTAEVPAVA